MTVSVSVYCYEYLLLHSALNLKWLWLKYSKKNNKISSSKSYIIYITVVHNWSKLKRVSFLFLFQVLFLFCHNHDLWLFTRNAVNKYEWNQTFAACMTRMTCYQISTMWPYQASKFNIKLLVCWVCERRRSISCKISLYVIYGL